MPEQRKMVSLRLDPAVHDALTRWAASEMISVNALIERSVRQQLRSAGRLPRDVKPIVKPGRPPRLSE